MPKRKPFSITIKGKTIVCDQSKMPRQKGLIVFRPRDYIKQHHPEQLKDFDQGAKAFNDKFKRIDEYGKKASKD